MTTKEQKKMPSATELGAYVKKLPPIYRDILKAFPEIEPGRKAGQGLAFQTLTVHLNGSGMIKGIRRNRYSFEEVQEACRRLAEMGFIEIRNEIFAHPTELGEKLIAAATGKEPAPQMSVPELPRPTW